MKHCTLMVGIDPWEANSNCPLGGKFYDELVVIECVRQSLVVCSW